MIIIIGILLNQNIQIKSEIRIKTHYKILEFSKSSVHQLGYRFYAFSLLGFSFFLSLSPLSFSFLSPFSSLFFFFFFSSSSFLLLPLFFFLFFSSFSFPLSLSSISLSSFLKFPPPLIIFFL
ncbi:hypothetical protein ACOSQ4_017199 [Xanthoceras sorbifolium]